MGSTSPRVARALRDACDASGISYAHFYGMRGLDGGELRTALTASASWSDALRRLGYAPGSGSARSTIRARAKALGIETLHLDESPPRDPRADWPFGGTGEARHLRRAASLLVAGKCALLGYEVSWPLEPAAYDLLLHVDAAGILRVQVKSGTRRMNGSWTVWITRAGGAADTGRRGRYSSEEIDYFGIVDGDRGVYMIPVDVVEGRTAVSLRAYERYRLAV